MTLISLYHKCETILNNIYELKFIFCESAGYLKSSEKNSELKNISTIFDKTLNK